MGRKRGKRLLQDLTPDERKAVEHGRQRQLYRSGNSWVVPVPPWARRIIARPQGGAVYWFEFRPGELVLTAEPTRAGGRPHGEKLMQQLQKLSRENTRLRRRLRAWPLGQLAQADNVGAMKGLRALLPEHALLEEIAALLRDVSARLPFRARRRDRGASSTAPVHEEGAVPARATPDPLFAPFLPSEEEAGTPEPSVPGAP